jgi:DNA-binding transcriptional ArsR family regulator
VGENTEKDVREIKWKVEGIEKSIDLLVRANRNKIVEDILKFFGKSKERVRVFLNIDGETTVEQIANSIGIATPNVSRRITELKDEGLISIRKIVKSGYIYEKTEKVKILSLEKELRKKFGIEEHKK